MEHFDAHYARFAHLHIQALIIQNMIPKPLVIAVADPMYELTMPQLGDDGPVPVTEPDAVAFNLEDELLMEFERYDTPKRYTFMPEDIWGLRESVRQQHPELSDEEIEVDIQLTLGLSAEEIRLIEAGA